MISIENLRIEVGNPAKTIVHGINAVAATGQMVALLGPNGAGKSTLLRAVAGDPWQGAGRVLWHGKPPGDVASQARQRAYLPQHHTLDAALTGAEVVALARLPFDESSAETDAIVNEVLAWTHTNAFTHAAYPTLSGGERQRLQLARILAQVWRSPQPLLLLDEPTNSLDPRWQQDLLHRVQQFTFDHQATTLVVLHDLNLAAHYCDVLWLMHQGQVVATGSPAEVLTVPQLQAVYGYDVQVLAHPVTGKPLIVPMFRP